MRTLDDFLRENFTPEEIQRIEDRAKAMVNDYVNGITLPWPTPINPPYGARKKHRRKMKKRNR